MRNFKIHGVDFVVADYRPRRNEYERGLRYQLLIRVHDGPREIDFSYRSTGAKFARMREAREYAREHIAEWL